MSNLNSVFDVPRGYPFTSALEDNFEPAYGVSLPEGKIVFSSTRQLPNVSVLKMKSDATLAGAPPTLTADDAGLAFVVDTWGAGYNDGDIVEWDGTDFVVIVENDDDVPPYGTRVIVVATGAAGSFSGKANHIMTYTEGVGEDPDVWVDTTTPATMNKIRVTGDGSRYEGMWFDYHDSAWVTSVFQKPPLPTVNVLTSAALADHPKDDAWIVIQGNDQSDSAFANLVTCLKLASGCTFTISHTAANTLVPGTLLQANAGVLEAYTSNWPVGMVIVSNGVAGSLGKITVASM